MILRVYLDGKLKREVRGDESINLEDRGRFAAGVEIPVGRRVKRIKQRFGKLVHRVDVTTEATWSAGWTPMKGTFGR